MARLPTGGHRKEEDGGLSSSASGLGADEDVCSSIADIGHPGNSVGACRPGGLIEIDGERHIYTQRTNDLDDEHRVGRETGFIITFNMQ